MRLVAAVALSLLMSAAGLEPSLAGTEQRLRIGPTGIYCIKAPCPWRGIVKIGADGRPQGRPLWTGEALPAIHAVSAIRKRIETSWRESDCLQIFGSMRGDRLTVSRIDRKC